MAPAILLDMALGEAPLPRRARACQQRWPPLLRSNRRPRNAPPHDPKGLG
jgi:hypothetical protein